MCRKICESYTVACNNEVIGLYILKYQMIKNNLYVGINERGVKHIQCICRILVLDENYTLNVIEDIEYA